MKRHSAQILPLVAMLALGTASAWAQTNDLCSGAITVQMGTVVSGNNVGATTGTPIGGCNITNDVWYKFVAPYSGVGVVSTCSFYGGLATFDTVINVWSFGNFCSQAVSPIACNDDSCGSLQSYVTFPMTYGVLYQIEVGGYNGLFGSFQIALFGNVAVPPNDSCATALPIAVNSFVAGENFGATTGPDPTANCGNPTRDMWYTFVAPVCGFYEASTCITAFPNTFDTVVGVWRGSCGALIAIGCDDDDPSCGVGGTLSKVTWAGELGTKYYISVAGFGTAGGAFRLTLNSSSPGSPTSLSFFNSGFGTLGYHVASGPPGGYAFTAIATAPGAYPYGWFHGIDISITDVVSEWLTGYPFVAAMGPSCGGVVTVGPFSGLPSGLTAYGVTLGLTGTGPAVPVIVSAPAVGTVP